MHIYTIDWFRYCQHTETVHNNFSVVVNKLTMVMSTDQNRSFPFNLTLRVIAYLFPPRSSKQVQHHRPILLPVFLLLLLLLLFFFSEGYRLLLLLFFFFSEGYRQWRTLQVQLPITNIKSTETSACSTYTHNTRQHHRTSVSCCCR